MLNDRWGEILAHRERLIAMARRRCPTPADAEDVVHEAMLRCATFDGLDPERLAQFLTSVTVRLCADLHRNAYRDGGIVRRLAAEPEPVESAPEDAVCGSAHAEAIEALVDSLPERQRAVLVDRARGLTMAEICTRRSLTYKAAESALARARGTLRQLLPSLLAGVTFVARLLLRRRRVLVAATVPVVAVIALGAVVKLPFRGAPPPASDPSPPVVPFVDDTAETTPRVTPTAVPRAGSRVHEPRKAPVVTSVSDEPAQPPATLNPVSYVERCVNEGVWVTVEGNNSYQGCGSGGPGPR